jgi:hypothetical protein
MHLFPLLESTIVNPSLVVQAAQNHVPDEFEHVVMTVREFIDPIVSALVSRNPPPARWSAPGPWV